MFTKNQQKMLALSIFIAVSFYFVFIFTADTNKILITINRLTFYDWLIILSCSFVSYSIRFIRWHYYIQSFGHFLPVTLHFIYYLAGFALTTTPAKAGETLRSVYLHRHGVKYSHSLASFFTERLLDVLVMLILASSILFNLDKSESHYVLFVISLIVIIGLLLPFLGSRQPQHILRFLIHHLSNKTILLFLKHALSLLQSAHSLLSIKILPQGIFLGFMAWFIQGLAFHFILIQVGFPLDLSMTLTIYALSILAGAASFIPGGIGATETVMGLMLVSAGSEPAIAIAVPILTRLATLWFAVCVGLLANAYLSVNNTKSYL